MPTLRAPSLLDDLTPYVAAKARRRNRARAGVAVLSRNDSIMTEQEAKKPLAILRGSLK
jgi:hypothetical protein